MDTTSNLLPRQTLASTPADHLAPFETALWEIMDRAMQYLLQMPSGQYSLLDKKLSTYDYSDVTSEELQAINKLPWYSNENDEFAIISVDVHQSTNHVMVNSICVTDSRDRLFEADLTELYHDNLRWHAFAVVCDRIFHKWQIPQST